MRINRRTFIKGAIGTVAAGSLLRPRSVMAANPRVLSIYDASITTWPGTPADGWQSDTYVDQSKMDALVTEGVKRLTNHSVELDAWTALFPTVTGSTRVGIKVNENNQGYFPNNGDWLPQLVNSVVKGLKVRGFTEPNIYLMDPTGDFKDTTKNATVRTHYPNLTFISGSGFDSTTQATWTSGDSSLNVTHVGYTTSVLCDQMLSLTYFILMPIMRYHAYQFTLSSKLCVGLKSRGTIPDVHGGMELSSNNPLVDIYANTNIVNKCKLIIGDAIYGGINGNAAPPAVWPIFGNDFPKRIFMSTDPVAVDSVMYDFLNWQNPRANHNVIDDAAGRGLGVQDHWNNTTQRQYTKINYVEVNMANPASPPAPPAHLKIL